LGYAPIPVAGAAALLALLKAIAALEDGAAVWMLDDDDAPVPAPDEEVDLASVVLDDVFRLGLGGRASSAPPSVTN